ncbi:hypothetical protein RN001_008029 [Aquatica leii]|uniref:Uncharacterized protein n=1 Tax=Aquatica leii TaxID=1421715 RepID=A0AAN7SP40_9COLE|nr:hypothetical protein RN001_008029 [Aquatica leii]
MNIKPIPKEKYQCLMWTDEEKIFRKRKKILKDYQVPVSAAIELKFKRSVFGIYLNSLNKHQIQSRDLNATKLDITNWEISSFTHVQERLFKQDNDISYNLYNLLVRAVKEQDCIDWEFLYDHVQDLHIYDFHMCVAYKDAVVYYLPHLGYLDNVEILKKDREVKKYNNKELLKGALIFTCHRIIGLPAPPKLKGVMQTIHVEVTLPLLQESIVTERNEEIPKTKNRPSTKGNVSYYTANDEYAIEKALNIENTAFKTKRMEWDKIMQTPNEYLCITSPEENLVALRDTFRSTVKVNVVYLVVNEEVILKKITIASFRCKLYDVNWSDKTNDYYWIDDPKCCPNAIPVKGSLRAINYVLDKPPALKKGATPAPPPTNKPPSREYLPNVFTCQVGFGLKRL